MTLFDYVAFGAMSVVFFAAIYLVILLGDLPAGIAKQRNHPQVPAIRAMSWFGLLFTGGIVWILAIVWAYFDPTASGGESANAELRARIDDLQERLAALEARTPETGGAS